MITNNQFILATACLFTIAMLGGCATNGVAQNSEQAAPTEAVAEVTATETGLADALDTTTAETTAASDSGAVVIPLDAAAAAASEPEEKVAAPDIPNIANELSKHHNTQWHSRSFTYRLYLGGQLNAEYSQEKDALTISADSGGEDIACEYSTKHGGLASVDESQVSTCNSLANELQTYLEEE